MSCNAANEGVIGVYNLSRKGTWFLLALIVLGGLALRLYGLRAESVWWDEYTSLKYLDAPNLPAFLRINQTLDPATMPVYDTFEYLWGRYVGHSVFGLRLASVVLGTFIILVMYWTGALAFGPVAGLVAAACVALSPIHRHFAQEIHMYGPVTLLTAASLYTLLRILRGGRGTWWVAHIVVNVLLMWSHTFGLLAPFVEGVYLLICHRRPFKRLFLWCVIHGILVVPLLLYITTIQFWSPEQTETWQRAPGFFEFLGDLFADDAVHLTYQMRATEQMHALALFHPLFDLAWLAAVGAAIVWGVRRVSRDRTPLLLLLLVLLPPIILYTASLVWRPCIFPRYTVYCSLGLYLLLGGAIASLPGRWMRVGGVGACTLLLAYQTAILFPGPQRTDWLSAGKLLKSAARPQDPVLVQVSIWKDVLLFNMGTNPNPMSSAETLDVLVDQAAFLLDQYGCGDSAHPCDRSVWLVVLLKYFASGPYKELDAAIAARGLRSKTVEFEGIEHILVYEITVLGKPVVNAKQPSDGHDLMEGYGNLAVALVERGDRATAKAAIRRVPGVESEKTFANDVYGNLLRAIDGNGDVLKSAGAVRALLEGYGYRKNNRLAAAADFFRKATELDPGYGLAFIELGMALVRLGDDVGAGAALHQVGQLNPNIDCYGNLAVALAQHGRYDAAKEAILRIPEVGSRGTFARDVYNNLLLAIDGKKEVPRIAAAVEALLEGYAHRKDKALDLASVSFQRATELDLQYALAFSERGMTLVELGESDKAVAPLRRACELDPDLGIRYGRLAQVLAEKGDPGPTRQAMDMFLAGLGQLGAGKMDEARKTFDEAARKDPKYALSYLCLAITDLAQGYVAECRANLDKAFVADPTYLATWRPFIVALFDTKDYNASWDALHRIEAADGSISTPFVERLRTESGRER